MMSMCGRYQAFISNGTANLMIRHINTFKIIVLTSSKIFIILICTPDYQYSNLVIIIYCAWIRSCDQKLTPNKKLV